jgi:PAS domain S-box-containing protein
MGPVIDAVSRSAPPRAAVKTPDAPPKIPARVRRRPGLPALLVAAVPVALTLLFIAESFQARHADAAAGLQAVAELQAVRIAEWLERRENLAAFIQDNPSLAENYRRFRDADDPAGIEDLQRRLREVARPPDFDAVTLFDPRGRALRPASAAPAPSAELRQAFAQARATRQVQRIGPYRDATGQGHLAYVVPLQALAPMPFVVLHLDPDAELQRILRSWPVPSLDGESLLVRREGDAVVFLDAPRLAEGPPLGRRLPPADLDPLAVRLLGGAARPGAAVSGRDARGVPALGVTAAVAGSDWLVLAKADRAQIAALAWREAPRIALAGLLALAATLAALFLLRRRQARAVAAHLRQARAGRLQAETALRESEARLRRFYDSGLLGVIYWNMDGRILDANDKFLDLVGYTREDLQAGRIDWQDITPPEYRHLDDASVAELRATGVNAAPLDKQYIRKDGTRVPILVAGAMLDEARFDGVAFVLDIAERKAAEEALRASEERLRRIARAGRIGFFEWNAATDTAYWSPEHYALFGFAPDTPITWERWLAGVHPEDRERVAGNAARLLERARAQGRVQGHTDEYRFTRPDGTLAWLESDVSVDMVGGAPIVRGAVREITARKAAEARLVYLASFPEQSPDPVVEADATGRVRYANPAALRLFPDLPEQAGAHPWLADWASLARRVRDAQAGVATRELDVGERVFKQTLVAAPEEGVIRAYGADVTKRRRAEALARQALAEIEDIYRYAPVGLCVLDTELRWLRINERMAETNGLPVAAHLGKRVRELLPELADAIEPELQAVLQTGRARFDVEVVGQTPSKPGLLRTWRAHWLPVLDARGQVVGVNTVVEEITARREAEQALRASELRYRSLVEATGAVTWSCPPSGLQVEPEPAWMAFTGQSAEEMLGTGWSAAVHPEDVAAVAEQWTEAVARGEPFRREFRLRRHDGHWRWVSAQAVPLRAADGRVVEWIGMHLDVTERKEGEAALRRSEARWNAALESFAEGAIMATEDERIFYWNPAAGAMHGLTRPEEGIEPLERNAIGFELWTPDGSRLLEVDEWPMRRIKRGEAVRDLELRLRRPDRGWERIVTYSGAMVETQAGERVIFLSVHDLTEQRRAEQALLRSREGLRRLAEASRAIIAETESTAMLQAVAEAASRSPGRGWRPARTRRSAARP